MHKGIIYCSHCIITNKKYIGQTIQEFKIRIKHHKNVHKKYDTKFYNAIKKYGWNNFIWGIIDSYEYEYLNEKEIYWIDYYNTFAKGYNMTLGGFASNSPNVWKKYALMNPEGKIISGYNISELSRNYNLDPSTISAVLSGKLYSHKGWKLPDTELTGGNLISTRLSKDFVFISPDGIIHKGKNITKFCRKNGLHQAAMCSVHRKSASHHKGWRVPTENEIQKCEKIEYFNYDESN